MLTKVRTHTTVKNAHFSAYLVGGTNTRTTYENAKMGAF